MEGQHRSPGWDAMDVEEVGHVGEVLQISDKVSPVVFQSRGIPETS
jgi:hypothetical protein